MFGWFKRKQEAAPVERRPSSIFSTAAVPFGASRDSVVERAMTQSFQRDLPRATGFGMDSSDIKTSGLWGSLDVISDAQLLFFAAQSFVGYQALALLSQHWLIAKACAMPAKDAFRNGYSVGTSDGKEVPVEVLAMLRDADKRMLIPDNLVEFVELGRVFGIRVALFKVDSTDATYYEKPFNMDGVGKGCYRGISQIDPTWMMPEFAFTSVADPTAIDFYEPTYWNVNGVRIHRSHLCIYRVGSLPDILKPTYQYGSVSVPQKIMERVYAAERTANEGPQLAMTKRLNIMKTDVTAALANEAEFQSVMAWQARVRDNYGTRIIGTDDEVTQLDTSLAELDSVIMTQYQLVCAAAEVPATKMIGTTPKGFNSTGEYEEASYHELLKSIQAASTPLLERHHALVIQSEIRHVYPELGAVKTTVIWDELDAPTAKEAAETRLIDANADAALVTAGAIDGQDVRKRLVTDSNSPYFGMGLGADDGVDDPLEDESDTV